MEKVMCDGTTICYAEQGKGEALILLHGYCGSSSYWDEVVPELARSYRCIVPDLRGHGKTDAPVGSYTIEQMGNDVLQLMDEPERGKSGPSGTLDGGIHCALDCATSPGAFECIWSDSFDGLSGQ